MPGSHCDAQELPVEVATNTLQLQVDRFVRRVGRPSCPDGRTWLICVVVQ